MLGYLAEVGGGLGGVGAGGVRGGVFVLAVEGDVCGSGDVEVQGVGPVVQLYALCRVGGAVSLRLMDGGILEWDAGLTSRKESAHRP